MSTVMSPLSQLLVLLFAASTFAALPKGWNACKRSAKNYPECFIKEVTKAIKSVTSGDKKLGVLPLDPLRITRLEIPNSNGPVNVNLSFWDLDVTGIKDVTLQQLKNDWKNLEATARIPDLLVLGQYKVAGKVLILPITGSGNCNLTFHDLFLTIKVHWGEMTKGGKKYFTMEKIALDLVPKRLYINLENLFNGDKALGDNMNAFVNENWEQILSELRPAITNALSQAFTQIANAILSKIPANEIDLK